MIVGFAGYAGAGKDTAAQALEPAGFVLRAFSDPLREMALEIDPTLHVLHDWGEARIWGHVRLSHVVNMVGWTRAKEAKAVRGFLQTLGMAARSTFGPRCWVEVFWRWRRRQSGHIALTSVRFPEELGVPDVIVWIDRPGVGPESEHPSENSVGPGDCNCFVVNDRDVATLHRRVQTILMSCVPDSVATLLQEVRS